MSEEPPRGGAEEQGRTDPGLERIIEKVSTEHGFDVRGYKRSTLYRRLRRRMSDAGCPEVEDYLVRLEADRHEYPQLINTILINVTEFFRDADAWEHLQAECLGPLLRERPAGEAVRAWSVGCATGEEAYSLAICLAEIMGDRTLRNVKIYATDVDEGALAQARAGIYAAEQVQHLSAERLERFFEELPGARFGVRREIRSAVIFGKHNVLVDPPISRLDVMVCRNVLIYFDNATQQQLLSRFHYALRPDGFLFLGKAETLMSRSTLFRPVEPRFRIFQRAPHAGTAGVLLPRMEYRDLPLPRMEYRDLPLAPRPQAGTQDPPSDVLRAIVEQTTDPVLVLDAAGRLVMMSPGARQLLRLPEEAVGRLLAELDERLRPMGLRIAIEDARSTGRAVRVEELQMMRPDDRPVHLSMDVQPLNDSRGGVTHLLLWGHDRSQEHELTTELTQVRQELETTHEELQTTNEELETTNEELQSTNEELETTNEELQSTNEELETTIEELQSTNEELETANDELRARQMELNTLAEYQEGVLSSLRFGLIVVNEDFVVTSWNRQSADTWGIRDDEAVGQVVFGLDIGLNMERLAEPLQRVIRGAAQQEVEELDATDRRGRPTRCRVRIHSLNGPGDGNHGAVLIVEAVDALPEAGG